MIFAAVAAIAAVSGIAGFNAQKQESKLSALTLANVEALTRSEITGWTEVYDSFEREYDYSGFTRHMVFHEIKCHEDGGPQEDCTPGVWRTYYDTRN